jgi:hypothetical protein
VRNCIDHEEFYRMLAGEVIDDAKIFSIKFQGWEHFQFRPT